MEALTPTSFAGQTLLVVDNEPLIALGIASAFEKAGANVTTTTTLKHALILAEEDGLSAAVIDHALVDGDTTELRRRLAAKAIPFILYSGFSEPVTEPFGTHVPRPATTDVLIETLMALFHGRVNKA
jgi:CheY-like chemotaxis protein